MIFNGIEKDYITVLRGRDRPFFESEDGRKITVPIYIRHDGFPHYQKLKEEIAYWLKHDEPKSLEFKDDDDRMYWAKVESIEQGDEYNFSADATIEFECDSKYSHKRTLTITDTLTSNIDGHKSTPWETKTTFTANKTSYELQFNAPNKTDLRSIGKIKLNYNFVTGDVLEIDYSKRKVTVNGVDRTNILVILQSNFMELPIGEVEFTASHKTEFYYHERYY